MAKRVHLTLDCGVELAVLHLPKRRAEAIDIRIFAGTTEEPADRLGLAHLVEETLDKGTERFDGRALSDAFDAIGVVRSGWCGREQAGFQALSLPEYFDRNVELHAEFLRSPAFPADSCEVAVELARQELLTLEDDAQALADKLIGRQAYGPRLGRHAGGESESLARITRDDFVGFWKESYGAGRMIVSAAGPIEPEAVAETINRHFSGFGQSERGGRDPYSVEFQAITTHHLKETEQQQISLAIPGVPAGSSESPAEHILIGVLAGGMSARLFTEIREKQGLVYWVGAWREHPRGSGMLFAGASTTPQKCDKTYATLLRELERVGEDVTAEEMERALAGICVRADVRGDMTRARCSEQVDDVIHYGKPIEWEEKLAKLRAVTVDDVKRYCAKHIANGRRSVVTLGPKALGNGEG